MQFAINPLNQLLNEDPDMKTIETLGQNNGVIAYADDLAVWCKDLETVAKLTTHLENFAKISGLKWKNRKTEKGKTEVIPVNPNIQYPSSTI